MIVCTSFRPFRKNTLQGFCDLKLTQVGIVIHDCCLHDKDGKRWISFPARPYETTEGQRWQPMLAFAEDARTAKQSFQRQALAAVEAVAGTSPAPAAPAGEGGRYVRTAPPRRPEPRAGSGFVDDPLDDLLPMEGDR